MLSSTKGSSALDKFLTLMFLYGLTTNEKVSDIQKEIQKTFPKNSKGFSNGESLNSFEIIERIFEKNYGYLFEEKEKKIFNDFFEIENNQSDIWLLKIKDLSINCKLCTLFSDDTYLEILNMLEPETPKKIPIPENSASTKYRKIQFLHFHGLISEHIFFESNQSHVKKTLFVATFDDINISINSKTLSNLQFNPKREKSEILQKFFN